MPTVEVTEVRATVQRLEKRMRASSSTLVHDLMDSYGQLKPRLSDDLQNERDMLLSCGGALMLIEHLANRTVQ